MNKLEYMLSFERVDRQTGRTTALARAAQEIDGIFIVNNEDTKRTMKKKFPELEIMTIHNSRLIGTRKPLIFDHFVIYESAFEASQELVSLRAEIASLKRKSMFTLNFKLSNHSYFHWCEGNLKAALKHMEETNYGSAKDSINGALHNLKELKEVDNNKKPGI